MKYRTIVADPPWQYEASKNGKFVMPKPVEDWGTRGVETQGYASMPVSDIAALPIRKLADDHAHLYLWTTNAFMEQAHQVARSWGFDQKTILTWGKVYQDDYLRPSMKTGFYYRGATEHVLFCVRGSLRLNGTWPTLFLWPRLAKHSQKPDAFYDLVEQASPGPYVELFARRHRLGWDVWGNESANTAEMPLGCTKRG
jgi:N6-adenosine-specific RNA methylase IME4